MSPGLEVLDAGTLTTVQDQGRPGFAHLGVPRAGALDAPAAALANRLVGNVPDAAVLETTATGCALRATGPMLVAVTGAPCRVFVGPVLGGMAPAPFASPVRLATGQTLELGAPVGGMRSYLAVRGGIAFDPVLGSRSTDTLSGLGPPPLAVGELVPVGASAPVTDREFAALRDEARRERTEPGRANSHGDAPPEQGSLVLSIRLGPREDWFTADAREALTSMPYTVSADSNRVGLRLTGTPLDRAVEGEIPSEGMVLGAVQVPPSGEPVVFLADHPTTGGYPVVGVVDASGIAAAAQARPGDTVRFAVIAD
ncbi:biotin-dependent carboxyltransferase family protein [Demequina muriae]|uniref:Biotin-dependent carboxyltransferase family protein n=1 Tax=Demequina muriae TaxID=3051664 RepID=A0ABT8GFS9_9MICO|nr:biotin-dependent carboxyltransferase family protein [Demequina sp. EGI L300058]MDN4480298.1 biotin-dependent carboxyltransferase family protein [Demequina sp. EGI L300058]